MAFALWVWVPLCDINSWQRCPSARETEREGQTVRTALTETENGNQRHDLTSTLVCNVVATGYTRIRSHTHTLAQAFVHALVHARDYTHSHTQDISNCLHCQLDIWFRLSERGATSTQTIKNVAYGKKKRKQNGNKKNENGQSKKGKQNKRQQRWKRAASTSELKLLQLLSRCYFYCCCCCCRCTLQLHSRKKSIRSEYRRAKSEKVNKHKWGVKIVGQRWLLCSVSSTL